MATTNFGTLLDQQKMVWERDVWKTARHNSFIMQMAGSGMNSVIQRITKLTASERGTKAVITLVKDLAKDGVMGDATLEGNEEAINAYDQEIDIDQMRHANRSAGKITEQATIVRFRETSRDVLGYWLADRVDQLAFNTLAGIDYRLQTNGDFRDGFSADGAGGFTRTAAAGQALYDLACAAAVTAPSANRHFRWDGANEVLLAGDTTTWSLLTCQAIRCLLRRRLTLSNVVCVLCVVVTATSCTTYSCTRMQWRS